MGEVLTISNGEAMRYAWPGGYPIFYLTKQGNILCPDCALEQEQDEDQFWNENDPIEAHDANYEDPHMFCEGCNERIESAYAEDIRTALDLLTRPLEWEDNKGLWSDDTHAEIAKVLDQCEWDEDDLRDLLKKLWALRKENHWDDDVWDEIDNFLEHRKTK